MRKQKHVTVSDEGRDKGKIYLLTEMSASQAEKWGLKALSALARGGLDIPEDVAAQGMAGVAAIGIRAFSGVDFDLVEPLLDEMMDCVEICPDKNDRNVTRPLIEDDIEEIKTRLMLRKEVFDLHTGFFSRASLSTSTPEKSPTSEG